MSVTITYFVHGTTTDNETDRATGWLPGELSELGIKQSKELGELVKYKHFDVVFYSDLKRAVESAHLAFEGKYEIVEDARLRECNYGDMNGKDAKLFKSHMHEYIDIPFPNGESYKDVESRMRDFILYLKNEFQGKNIAIVAHQAPQLALEVIINKKSWQNAIDQDWRKVGKWQPGWEYEV